MTIDPTRHSGRSVGSGWVSQQFSSVRRFAAQRVRYEALALIFVVMTINLADRAAMSIAATPMSAELHLNHLQLGWIFSSFAWAYVLFQLPGGWALDQFGAKRTYTFAIFVWSICSAGAGFAPLFGQHAAGTLIFVLIFMIGMAAAPSYPTNAKIVLAWFPAAERGTASAVFNATQYFAAAVFTPVLALLAANLGWRSAFFAMGAIGIAAGVLFALRLKAPLDHPRLTSNERELIKAGGGTLNMDGNRQHRAQSDPPRARTVVDTLSRLIKNRVLFGISFAQYCVSTLSFFFIMWVPVYLVQQRHIPLLKAGILASVPAICGFSGGLLGGMLSDFLLRRGRTLTVARKVPIYIGMLMASTIALCNYVDADWLIVTIMALAFFGKSFGAQGWAVIVDTSPVNEAGLNASVFNTFSSASGITTPIAIGFLVNTLNSFNGALIFVAVHALLAIASYAFVVGAIRRIDPV